MYTLNKYLIDYQLEDVAPEHKVVSGEDKEEALSSLKDILIKEQIDFGLEKLEAREYVETITILEIKEV